MLSEAFGPSRGSSSLRGPATTYTPFSFNFHIFYIIYKLDLSCKYLTEEISLEIGRQLQEIHLLNLSHNCLSVYKPKRYSKLKVVESLDFSYNRLSGRIPP